MNQPTLSPASQSAVAVALAMVNESRQRMNNYSDSVRESLEMKGRALIQGCQQEKAACKVG